MIDALEDLVNEYYKTSDKSLVKKVFLLTRSYVDEWLSYQSSNLRSLSDEARQDISLTVVSNIIKKSLRTNVQNHIRNLINERARHDRTTRIYSAVTSGKHVDIDTRVRVSARLKQLIAKYPVYIRGSVLYLMRHADQIDRFVRNNDVSVAYRVLYCIFEIRKALSMSESELELPESQTSKMLVLSNLYKHNPMALAVLMQVKSIDKFYQLCKLSEHHKLQLPTAYEFNNLVEKAVEMGNKLEGTTALTIQDRQALALMATTETDLSRVNPDSEVVPVLAQYFVHSITEIVRKSMEVQENVLKNLDTTNPEQVGRMYQVLNREVATQVRMVQEIVGAITTSEALNRVLTKLESQIVSE